MVKVSVIVPVYNCEDFIEESIDSLLAQTFKDIEVICIDDGSGDGSLEILNRIAERDSRLKVHSQENQGSSIARNNGLKMARGDYIYFFDADDYLLEDGLEKAYVNALKNNSDIVFFKFDQYREGAFHKHLGLDIEEQFPNADFHDFTFTAYDYRKRAFRGPFAPWFKLYKKEFLDSQDYFEFPPGLNHNDVPFHVKTFLKASAISFLPEYLYHYRIDNPNSISNTRSRRYADIFSIIQIVEDFLKEEGLYDEFKKEFEYFKMNRIVDEIRGRPEEYLNIAKRELSEIDLENELSSKNVRFKSKAIVDSNSIEEYNLRLEVNSLEKKNAKLSRSIKELKGENKELKAKNDKLKKDKDEILSSNSWKLTESFRRSKKFFKK